MGVDINPGHACWAYGGFARFREALAEEEGLKLRSMEGYGGELSWEHVNTTLAPLLNHSDCDGFLSPWDCKDMLPRLREIRHKWRDLGYVDRAYDVGQMGQLIYGMEHCVEHRCAVVFS